MNLNANWNRIFEIQSDSEFLDLSLEAFNHQYNNCDVYKTYCDLIRIKPNEINCLEDIPFIPIQFFKSHHVKSGSFQEEIIFTSSGTTGSKTSQHLIKDLNIYTKSFLDAFDQFYPNWKSHCIIGLLPSYLEREGSSLIYMVDHLIANSDDSASKFQLELNDEFINFLENDPRPKIMFGVTFALLDLAEKGIQLNNTVIIETGGMKGKRKEITRDELHEILRNSLSPKAINSEYGMTELLSQAYLQKDSFDTPAWMKTMVRPTTDPLLTKVAGKGVLNIIDLANIHSCSFIATDDLGEVFKNGSFVVKGRIDHSQVRGCNLMVD